MTNDTENDYEKKFQEDLERATALSLETLALEKYRRSKLYSSNIGNTIEDQVQYRIRNRRQEHAVNTTSDNDLPIVPPPTQPRRRHSEVRLPEKSTDLDLISFTNPPEMSKETETTFDKLIADIKKMSEGLGVMAPAVPNISAAAVPNPSVFPAIGSQQNVQNMQIVPFQLQQFNTSPASSATPLTYEKLNELYKMTPRMPYASNFVNTFSTSPMAQNSTNPFNFRSPQQYQFQTHLSQQTTPQTHIFQPPQQIQSPQLPSRSTPPPFTQSPLVQGSSNSVAQLSNTSAFSEHTFHSSQSSTSLSMAQLPVSDDTGRRKDASPSLSTGDLKISGSTAYSVIKKRSKKPNTDDLIDWNHEVNSRVSVLEAFDPLMNNDSDEEDTYSGCGTSYYSEYDPFDYLYSSGTKFLDPVEDAVNKSDQSVYSSVSEEKESTALSPCGSEPPPLPPRNPSFNYKKIQQSRDTRKSPTKLYQNVKECRRYEDDLMEFFDMVKALRSQFPYNQKGINQGYVIASEFDYRYPIDTSIKLLVHPSLDALKLMFRSEKGSISGYGPPVAFTCDVITSVEHVIMQAFYALERQIEGLVTDFVLKPIGVNEWLSTKSKLCQLECVHNCIKIERDVHFGLCRKIQGNMFALNRTEQDDVDNEILTPGNILPNEQSSPITFNSLMILVETLETEIDKLELSATDASSRSFLVCSGVVQAVKAICALFGSIETLHITSQIQALKTVCELKQITYVESNHSKLEFSTDHGDYVDVILSQKSPAEAVKYQCDKLRDAVQMLIKIYASAFRVDFCLDIIEYESSPIPMMSIERPVSIYLSCLHRAPVFWKYDIYKLVALIYHGTRYISETRICQCLSESSDGFFPRLKFDEVIRFDTLVSALPRESRLVFVLYGCTLEPAENESNNESSPKHKPKNTELGWCSLQFFDYHSTMISGSYLLSIWPPTNDKSLGPAPAKGTHPQAEYYPVLSIDMPDYGGPIYFPKPSEKQAKSPSYDFYSLDCRLQEELIETAQRWYESSLDKREVLWEKRHYLQNFPHALPKILHAAHSWDFYSAEDIHAMLRIWTHLSPLEALELLLPRYPDMIVREQAVTWMTKMPNDQLVDFLPQLLQALKHDTYDNSAMARFLLQKCLESPRIAHHLYWLLVQSLPGECPQNSMNSMPSAEPEGFVLTEARYHRRNQMMLRSLLAICGEKQLSRFLSQEMLCKRLAEAAIMVKQTKESLRQTILVQDMQNIHQLLIERPTALPLGPQLEVSGINARNCSYFNSNTLPLKIEFQGSDHCAIPAIFKCGDDLQQDMLTIQIVRIMDKLWLSEGLDLKMVTFNCVPTGYRKGIIECITEAETLRKIQVEYGLTGSFKDKPIAEWLAKKNPSQLEYQRAVDNFSLSCAGYSVATYILGICDRHNDNIMLKTSGHLFHIDFGKFLGDAQMFGNFKRDRTPFVLTSDMAYVINGGEKSSPKFQDFVDRCCRAFNIVRKHGNLFLHMLALMATAGIPGVTAEAVTYVRNALLPSQLDAEAAATFAKMIQSSLKSKFTQFNFFLHNLAQFRFTGEEENNGELLSFVPRTYTEQQDGRLKVVCVVGFEKRYDLEKYYIYILNVSRQGQPDPASLFRTYKEFLEFHQKLCIHFPLAKLHSLPNGVYVGRTNVKTVAQRRVVEIKKFLDSLFISVDEIAHSDLVYTFFHPLLRDQQEANEHMPPKKESRKVKSTENVSGKIKLSLHYRRGVFTVMIYHVVLEGLRLSGGQEPNMYVKCYLKPDYTKSTKRKTKVVRKTVCPSFMETLEYRMSLENVQSKLLQVTVWSHDSLQENENLGGVEILLMNENLRTEKVDWFPLKNIPRS